MEVTSIWFEVVSPAAMAAHTWILFGDHPLQASALTI